MRLGLGAEHPLCDIIQLVMIILFFVCWGLDSLSFFLVGYSTVIFGVFTSPVLLIGTLLFFCLSLYFVSMAHKVVFSEDHNQPKLIDSGVYALVRHPMYLGILLLCLSFLFINLSLISIGIWIIFFFFYDKMATFEVKSLIEILGEKYVAYQKRVSKWLPILKIKSWFIF